MSVRVLEVSCVAAPEGIVCWLHNDGTCGFRLVHHRVDFSFRRNIVADGELGRIGAAKCDSSIMSDTFSRPKRQLQARLQIEERHRAILELCADDPFGFQAKTIAVELYGPL